MSRKYLRMRLVMALGFAMSAGTGVAQVYKWTDATGQVHYADRKDGVPKAEEVKIKLAPQPPAAPKPPPPLWPAPAASAPAWPPPVAQRAEPPRSVSGGREDGSDASRCALARDVLNGSLQHGNGAAVDQHDRDIANADVKRFCR